MKKLLLALSVVVLLSAATIATTLWLWTGTPHGRLTVPAAVISKLSAWQESPFSRLTLQEQRVAFRESMQKLTGDTIPLADVRNLRIAGPGGPLPLRVYTPERTDRALPVIVYLHGGAWVWGDLRRTTTFVGRLRKRLEPSSLRSITALRPSIVIQQRWTTLMPR